MTPLRPIILAEKLEDKIKLYEGLGDFQMTLTPDAAKAFAEMLRAADAAIDLIEEQRRQLEKLDFEQTLLMSMTLTINGLAKIGKMTNDEVLAITNKVFARIDEHRGKCTLTDDLQKDPT